MPGTCEDGESGPFGWRREADVALETDEPFGVISRGLVPGIIVVVDYPTGLVLDFGVGGDLKRLRQYDLMNWVLGSYVSVGVVG